MSVHYSMKTNCRNSLICRNDSVIQKNIELFILLLNKQLGTDVQFLQIKIDVIGYCR